MSLKFFARISFTCLLIYGFAAGEKIYAADLLPNGPIKTRAFYSMADPSGWQVEVRGIVYSAGVNGEVPADDLSGQLQEKSAVTVRLYSGDGLQAGDELFVIDSKNLITARIRVNSVFRSVSLGWMLTGTGNFIMCSERDRVVQRVSKKASGDAVAFKSRGDYYREHGDYGRAVSEYKKALDLDSGSPDVHLAIGEVYMEQGIYQFAYREFQEAEKNLYRLYDNEDKFSLLKNMGQIRLIEIRTSPVTQEKKEELRKDGIDRCREALKYYSSSPEVNFCLGSLYYLNPVSFKSDEEDRTARDCFLKVVEVKPDHAGANTCLAELYLKHGNKEKAEMYASKALKKEPGNARASAVLKQCREN